MSALMDRTDAHRVTAWGETLARGWVGVLGLLLCTALPVLWVERVEGRERHDEYLSFWSAFPALVDSRLRDVDSGVSVALVGLVLLGLGLLSTGFVCLAWITAGLDDAGVGPWVGRGTAALLLVGAGLLLVGAAMVPPTSFIDGDPRVGLGAGAGLWAPVVLALVLATPRLNPPTTG